MEEMEEIRATTLPQEVNQEDTKDSSQGDTFGLWVEGILLVEISCKFSLTILTFWQALTFCVGLVGNSLCIITFYVKKNKENLQIF